MNEYKWVEMYVPGEYQEFHVLVNPESGLDNESITEIAEACGLKVTLITFVTVCETLRDVLREIKEQRK